MAEAHACHRHVMIDEKVYRTVSGGAWSNPAPPGRPGGHGAPAPGDLAHAARPAGMDRLVGPKQLQQALGYPTDVGLAAASVLTGGLLHRCPALRLAFSHGGGTLGLLLPRLMQARAVMDPLRTAITDPTAQARLLHENARRFLGWPHA